MELLYVLRGYNTATIAWHIQVLRWVDSTVLLQIGNQHEAPQPQAAQIWFSTLTPATQHTGGRRVEDLTQGAQRRRHSRSRAGRALLHWLPDAAGTGKEAGLGQPAGAPPKERRCWLLV